MKKKICLALLGLTLVSFVGCGLKQSYQQSVDYGQKHIDKIYKSVPAVSYADFADSVKKVYSLKDHKEFVRIIQSLGEYLAIKADDWSFNSEDGVDTYIIDFALKYPDYTQYARLTIVKANGKFQMISDRFMQSATYKKLKAQEKAAKEKTKP